MSKLIDLTGKRFGKWTVLERAENKNGKTFWKCRCDCGTEREIYSVALTSGKSESCGCGISDDLTGKRFGRLTVIEKHGYTNGKRKLPTWLCRCDCGNTAIRTGKALKDSKNSGCDDCRWIYINLTGKRFGKLTVISIKSSKDGEILWKCVCDCGNEVQASTAKLNFGSVTSCGCGKRERIIEQNTTHGLSKTRLYKIWVGIKKRCYNENSKRYDDYGGRGITVCKEWRNDFQAFYKWAIENGYNNNLTIERKDVNGNYRPENCCWIPTKEQARNQRKTIRYTLFGIEKPLVEWCEYAEIKNSRAYQRYKNGNNPFNENELAKIKLKLENGGI